MICRCFSDLISQTRWYKWVFISSSQNWSQMSLELKSALSSSIKSGVFWIAFKLSRKMIFWKESQFQAKQVLQKTRFFSRISYVRYNLQSHDINRRPTSNDGAFTGLPLSGSDVSTWKGSWDGSSLKFPKRRVHSKAASWNWEHYDKKYKPLQMREQAKLPKYFLDGYQIQWLLPQVSQAELSRLLYLGCGPWWRQTIPSPRVVGSQYACTISR